MYLLFSSLIHIVQCIRHINLNIEFFADIFITHYRMTLSELGQAATDWFRLGYQRFRREKPEQAPLNM